jgi:hypothetical protein
MSATRYRSPAEEVLAALDADAVLIEHYDPDEIERAPIDDIWRRLCELELAPSVAAGLQKVITASARSPAAELLDFLKADTRSVELRNIEARPLAEVTKELRRLGVNYRAGVAEILSPVDALHEGNAEVQVPSHEGAAEARALARDQPQALVVSSTKRSRKQFALVTTLAAAAVLLAGVNICNLYTIFSQREQIRDLKIAMDTKPAQLQQILALNESKACRGHMYVAYRLADRLLDKAPPGGSSD